MITVSQARRTVATTIVAGLTLTAEAGQARGAATPDPARKTWPDALIFCNRKRDVDILYKSLARHGFSVGSLHGDMSQPARFATLDKFKKNELRLLVCSDVAARGIDIGGLSHVFNFDVPHHAEDYVHRIGRTGRAGLTGHAFTLCAPEDRLAVEAIEKLTGFAIPRIEIPDLDVVEWADGDSRKRRGGRAGGGRASGGRAESGTFGKPCRGRTRRGARCQADAGRRRRQRSCRRRHRQARPSHAVAGAAGGVASGVAKHLSQRRKSRAPRHALSPPRGTRGRRAAARRVPPKPATSPEARPATTRVPSRARTPRDMARHDRSSQDRSGQDRSGPDRSGQERGGRDHRRRDDDLGAVRARVRRRGASVHDAAPAALPLLPPANLPRLPRPDGRGVARPRRTDAAPRRGDRFHHRAHRQRRRRRQPRQRPHRPQSCLANACTRSRKPGGKRAILLDLLQASPDRVAPPCPLFEVGCGGCALQHWADASYAAWKRGLVEAALTRAGFHQPNLAALVRTPPFARRRMDLAAERRPGAVALGLHRAHGQEVVDLTVCHILDPVLFALLDPLRATLRGLAALRARGSVLVNLLDDGADLLIRTDGPLAPTDRAKLAAYATAAGISRIAWALGDGAPETAYQLGAPSLQLGGQRVEPPPGTFLQASAAGEAAIVEAVLAAVPARRTGRSRAIELYAGSGTLSFALGRHLRVQAYEGDAAAAQCVRRAQSGTRVEMTQRDLARQPLSAKELAGAAMVVLDPPHDGAAAQMPSIAASGVACVVYVSCNPGALGRDAAVLARAGYRLACSTPIDQFLWSAQVESVNTFIL